MKLTKKLASLALVLLMLCAMTTNVFAATPEGTITINNIQTKTEGTDILPVATYSIYKMLDLGSFVEEDNLYSYVMISEWKDFFENSEFIAIDSSGIITWLGTTPEDTAQFAKDALAYADTHGISPVKTTTNFKTDDDINIIADNEDGKKDDLKFSNLDLGYYLIDSSVGALCGLTSTDPNGKLTAKNVAPTIEKQVQEDSLSTVNGETGGWSSSNTAQIGQEVFFHVTINVHEGAQGYILHDTMSEGLTFDGVTKVVHVKPGSGIDPHPATAGSDYTVYSADGATTPNGFVPTGKIDPNPDNYTFEVRFTDAFCNKLDTNDKVVIYYKAILNEKAEIGTSPDTNTAILEFGEEHFTTPSQTETYTYAIDLVKTNDKDILISGAKFKIYDVATGGSPIALTLLTAGDEGYNSAYSNYAQYRLAIDGDSNTVTEITLDKGLVRIIGLDNGSIWFEETEAPEGYSKIEGRQKYIIGDQNADAIITPDAHDSTKIVLTTNTGVQVVNRTGTVLPETGGIGTTIFYVTGAALALGAVVLLVTKKRMGAGE